MNRRIPLCAAFASLVIAASSAQAALIAYGAADEFSITNGNPNGVWTCGPLVSIGGSFTNFRRVVRGAQHLGGGPVVPDVSLAAALAVFELSGNVGRTTRDPRLPGRSAIPPGTGRTHTTDRISVVNASGSFVRWAWGDVFATTTILRQNRQAMV